MATQRPVQRFVSILAAVAVAFAALWWSGYAAPRVSATATGVRVDPGTGRATTLVKLRNNAPTSVVVRSLDVSDDGVELGPFAVGGQDVTGHLELPGGGSAVLEVDVAVSCSLATHPEFADDPRSGYVTDELLRVGLQTPVGLDRALVIRVKGALNPLILQLCTGRA